MTGRGTRWERWLPGYKVTSGGMFKVLNWNLHLFRLLEIIQVLDSISWVRCASGNIKKMRIFFLTALNDLLDIQIIIIKELTLKVHLSSFALQGPTTLAGSLHAEEWWKRGPLPSPLLPGIQMPCSLPGWTVVVETFSKSSSEQVPSECRHCRLTSDILTKVFFTSRQPRYIADFWSLNTIPVVKI